MSVIAVFILLSTIAQVFTGGFSLWWIIGLICRIVFMLRNFGIIFKSRPLMIGEAVSLGIMLVWYLIFNKANFPITKVIWNIGFTAIVVFLEWLDGTLYVYEVIDDDEYEQ